MSYLLLDDYDNSDRDTYQLITGGGVPVEIDEIDHRLLDELAENARMPLVELAEKVGCSSQTIDYRMKNLRKKDVIQASRIGVDNSKLGFEHFKVDIYLKEPSQRKKIFDYLKYSPYVTFINTSAGYADIEVELVIQNSDKMVQLMDEISAKFPKAIKKYTYFSSIKDYKLRCLPQL
jgi:DNA-binding Lrp family transcriptional regulator